MRLPTRRIAAECIAVLLLLASVAELAHRYEDNLTHRLELDRASLRIRARDVWVGAAVRYIEENIPPGDPLFVYGNEAYFYYLSDRFFPWPFVQLYPGMAGGDDGRELAARVLSLRPPLVVKGALAWEGVPDLTGYTPILNKALRSHYQRTNRWLGPKGRRAFRRPKQTEFALWELRRQR